MKYSKCFFLLLLATLNLNAATVQAQSTAVDTIDTVEAIDTVSAVDTVTTELIEALQASLDSVGVNIARPDEDKNEAKLFNPTTGKKRWEEYKSYEDLMKFKADGYIILKTKVDRNKFWRDTLPLWIEVGKFIIKELFECIGNSNNLPVQTGG